ncbi:MAG TPA: GAF domain-containing protein, partial [Gaiellaceae bacterium]|nr:GAF domain-containing protein [Gaiellaceae bacterium]
VGGEDAEKIQGALYRIAELASAARDMQEFYRAIHEIVGELMYAENLFIALFDEERGRTNWPYFADARLDATMPDPNEWLPFERSRSLTGYVLRTGEPQHLSGERITELVERGEIELLGDLSEDWLGVPLKQEGRTVGALVVQSYTLEHRYTDEDRDLLAFVGQHVGAALSRARAIEETRQRNAELALINSVQSALAGELEMQAIYDVVGDKVREIFDTQGVIISILDETSGLLSFPYFSERGQRLEVGSRPPESGFMAHVIETREPVLIAKDVAAAADRYGSALLGDEMPKSILYVPLLTGRRANGVISLLNHDREHAFDEADQRLLETLASSLSVALENARLVHETRQRNAELALINGVQEALAGELDMQAIYDVLGDRIRDVFDAQATAIAIYDEVSGMLQFRYAEELGTRNELPAMAPFGFRKHVLETGKPLLINQDVEAEAERYGNRVIVGEMPKSVLFVPLAGSGKTSGVIDLQNIDREHAFTDSDVQLLDTLARTVSVALENARLVHETRQRNAELALINSVQEAIAGELDPQTIYDAVGHQIREIFDAQVVSIVALDQATGLMHFPYMIDRGERLEVEPQAPRGLGKHVLETREPLLLTVDVEGAHERYGDRVVAGEMPKTALFVPLVAGGKATGLISLQNVDREHAFGESDQQLLETLAGSLSVALENARLVHETRQRNAELALINSVQSALAGELDMQAIYDAVGEKIREIFDAQVVDIAILDEATGLLDFPYVIERGEHLGELKIPLIGFRKHVIETREPLVIRESDPGVFERYGNPRVLQGDPTKCGLFVPLIVGGRGTGVISLQNMDREDAFGEPEQRLLTTLAGSLGVALENARLVHETRQRNAELALINSVQEAIAGELEQQAIYDAVGERIREIFDAQVVDIGIYDAASQLIHFPYTIERGERFPDEPMELIGFRKHVMETREPLLIGENMLEAVETYGNPAFWVGEQAKSWLGVPLMAGGRPCGVLSLQNVDREHAFGKSDQQLLETLAGSLSVALENARLVHETRQRNA